ncbi:DUF2750 domain-containing protein [Pseudomonas sichuanensis]|uniref:DUF2750 domain-containing protein n=1 Tax=Pseudomonas TaxID=286 RepID=UPI00215E14A5|nr:DUF2750 domain-containing protein [Pseudomonas sichuanensis]UVK83651.1 DUF2750 domain-containing protein [Pseudomonas sichuanensis]
MHEKKINNISAMKAEDRFDYFVRKVSDFEVVWGLRDQGWATSGLDGREVVPFWPEEDFARLCAVDEWSGFSPCQISVGDFLEKWLPGMQGDNRLCQIFPVRDDVGFVINPAELESALRAELEQYE